MAAQVARWEEPVQMDPGAVAAILGSVVIVTGAIVAIAQKVLSEHRAKRTASKKDANNLQESTMGAITALLKELRDERVYLKTQLDLAIRRIGKLERTMRRHQIEIPDGDDEPDDKA